MAKVNEMTEAQLAADAAKSQQLANFAIAKDVSLETMRELGRDMAKGEASITSGAFEFQSAVLGKLAAFENAADWYKALIEGYNSKAGEFKLDAMATDAVGIKQSVSIFATFGRDVVAAVVSKVPGFYDRVVALRATLTKEARAGSPYNTMVVTNRRITDAIAGGTAIGVLIGQLNSTDGDKLILSWIAKEVKAAKTLPQMLRAMAKSMEAKAEKTGFSELESAAKALERAALGIEVKLANADAMIRVASQEAAEIIRAAQDALEAAE